MSRVTRYQPSAKGQTFIDSVRNGKYDRQIIKGLKTFLEGNAHEDIRSFYSPDELTALAALRGTERDVEKLVAENPAKTAYVTQTTLSVDDARKIVDRLRKRFPNIVGPAKDDICYATQNRQQAIKELRTELEEVLAILRR